jgi:negative regulator of replication initiation
MLKPNANGTTIRIDAEVYSYLAKYAKGFESPNDVLRRLLKIDVDKREK